MQYTYEDLQLLQSGQRFPVVSIFVNFVVLLFDSFFKSIYIILFEDASEVHKHSQNQFLTGQKFPITILLSQVGFVRTERYIQTMKYVVVLRAFKITTFRVLKQVTY